MKNLADKIKKLDPIVKTKELRLQEESSKLESIRDKRHGIFTKLRETERKYIEGVELVNSQKTLDIASTEAFSQSLDYVKSNWHKTVTELKNVELEERHQIRAVLEAQKELRSTEILQEKYQADLDSFINKKEQKIIDELSQRKSSTK